MFDIRRRHLFIAIVSLAIIGGVVGVFAVTHRSPSATQYGAINACDRFTLAEAKSLLGANTSRRATKTDQFAGNDVHMSSCTYTNNATSSSSAKTASVLVRSALNAAGAASNRSGYDSTTPLNVQRLAHIGTTAYFAPSLGQLNVLDGNNWYIISSGGHAPADRTLQAAQQVTTLTLR